jgi:WD40 repeat protein
VVAWDVSNFNQGQMPPDNFLKPLQLFPQEGVVTGVEFGPDNTSLFTGSLAKVVKIWKLASPNPLSNMGHPNIVDAVVFSPDNKLVASGCHDGHIRIYDVEKKNVVKDINAHTKQNETMIYSLAFSPDGKQIVSAGYDNSLKLWNVENGAAIREFKAYKEKEFDKGHKESVFSVAFSPDGKFIASGSGGQERVIKIWDVNTGQVVREFDNPEVKKSPGHKDAQSHPGWIYRLRFTKDGQKLISAGDAPRNRGYLAVWNFADGKLLVGKEMPLGSFYGLDLSPDNQFVAIGAGPRGRPTPEFNSAYLLKLAEIK